MLTTESLRIEFFFFMGLDHKTDLENIFLVARDFYYKTTSWLVLVALHMSAKVVCFCRLMVYYSK